MEALVIEVGSVEGARARVTDLSWGGARLETSTIFPHGTQVRLMMQQTDRSERVPFVARVVRTAPGVMGVSFGPLDEASYDFLWSVCGASPMARSQRG